jgi:hypothetical protein
VEKQDQGPSTAAHVTAPISQSGPQSQATRGNCATSRISRVGSVPVIQLSKPAKADPQENRQWLQRNSTLVRGARVGCDKKVWRKLTPKLWGKPQVIAGANLPSLFVRQPA